MNRIRPLAICVFSHQGKILVSEGYDPSKEDIFYRPLGGAIEFGPGKAILYPDGLLELLRSRG